MSDHAWVVENLAAYLADGLEPAERERLDQHTAECASCAAALVAASDVDAALSGLFAAARPGPALEDRVIQSLRTRTQESAWRLPVPGWFVFAAAAVVLLALTGAGVSQLLVSSGLSFPAWRGPQALSSAVCPWEMARTWTRWREPHASLL